MLKSILNSLVWWPLPTRLLNTGLTEAAATELTVREGLLVDLPALDEGLSA